jgi:hypothetical protein
VLALLAGDGWVLLMVRQTCRLRPWACAWGRWAALAAVSVSFVPSSRWFLLVVAWFGGCSFWTWSFRFEVISDGSADRLHSRCRTFNLRDLVDVRYSSGGWGYPKMLLYFDERCVYSLGTYFRWGPKRWRMILAILKPYVDSLELRDAWTRRYWQGVTDGLGET